jgi:hypothetical protein
MARRPRRSVIDNRGVLIRLFGLGLAAAIVGIVLVLTQPTELAFSVPDGAPDPSDRGSKP